METIRRWGDASLKDLELASDRLRSCKGLEFRWLSSSDPVLGIDLENPVEGQIINNFHELSMREARRVDLRNGVNVTRLIAEEEGKWRGGDPPDGNEQSIGTVPFLFFLSLLTDLSQRIFG